MKPNAEKTRARQDAWITEYLRNGHNATEACKTVGIGSKTPCRWKREDPDFAQRLAERIAAKQSATKVVDVDTAELLRIALKRIRQDAESGLDSRVALEVAAALLPEVWDSRVRAKLWEQQRRAGQDSEPPAITLVRGNEPLRLVKKEEEKTGTE